MFLNLPHVCQHKSPVCGIARYFHTVLLHQLQLPPMSAHPPISLVPPEALRILSAPFDASVSLHPCPTKCGLPLSPLVQQPEMFYFITKGLLPDLATRQGMKGLIVQGFILIPCHNPCGQEPRQAGWLSCCYGIAVSRLMGTVGTKLC